MPAREKSHQQQNQCRETPEKITQCEIAILIKQNAAEKERREHNTARQAVDRAFQMKDLAIYLRHIDIQFAAFQASQDMTGLCRQGNQLFEKIPNFIQPNLPGGYPFFSH